MTAMLRALRAQAGQIDAVHIGDVSVVKQVSDKAAEIVGMERLRPTVKPVIDSLNQYATQISNRVRFTDVGTVQRIGDGVAKLSGLPSARTEELVTFPTGVQGMILNLEQGSIDVILLGSDEGIQGGDLVTGSGERLQVPVGRKLLGRIVNPLGMPLDGRGPVEATNTSYLERDAPGITERVPVHDPLYTGLKVIDSMLAIGRGMMSNPTLLLVDEPSFGLAPLLTANVFESLDTLRKSGVTTLLVEQNVTKTLSVTDRGYVLENGKIELAGKSADLANDAHVRKE